MKDTPSSFQEMIAKQLGHFDMDLVGILPVPAHGDRMVRLQTLQDILDEFQDSEGEGAKGFILQIRPKAVVTIAKTTPTELTKQKKPGEVIYLKDGKLNVAYLLRNADLLFEASEFGLAKNIYTTLLQSGEYPGPLRFKIGKCCEAEGKLVDAALAYEDSIAYHPTLEAYRRLATIYTREGKDQKSAETLERALHFKDLTREERFEVLKACGNSWTRLRKIEAAELCFKRALELNPSADDVQTNLGILYLQEKNIGDAKRCFQDAVATNPRNYQAISGLGSCYLGLGEKSMAHDHFIQSLRIELNNPSAIYLLVKCAYELKSYSSAAAILEEYIQVAPIHPNLLYSLAGLQYHLGRITDAQNTSLRIIAIQPEHKGAQDLLRKIEKYLEPIRSNP